MKNFGHTKTLFINGGKYKWSYWHDTCIECKSPKKPHKGNGLCVACFDKKRAKNRKGALKRQSWKHYYKKKLLFILETSKEYRKKSGPKANGFNKKEYAKKWYKENKEILLLLSEVARRKSKGLPCLEMLVNGKSKYFPFDGINKPNNVNMNSIKSVLKYEEYKIREKKYTLLYNWYIKNSET